ncbi:hypothetical protein LWI28_028722 [Acer negundo]|uniref:Uncharacterized protein n=1 Tax=Acer negundo TaxID=4023 RepID=A0AAD5NWY7_ACENE|nr:hypothetical protein LWI28_028722 [Acer negundo]KAK4852835.1 hypothetical protein QYF36_027436 [Acer negundo]
MVLLQQDLSFSKTLNPTFSLFLKIQPPFYRQTPQFSRLDVRAMAGRSKKTGGPRIRGNSKRRPKYRPVNIAETPYFRLKNSNKSSHPDNFTEEELETVGLGYDRWVRFMEKDDPELRHPYDWYKYGEYGPYSWRGVVVGEPIRGRFSDERVTIYGPVKNQEEWEEIEQHEMCVDFGHRLKMMDKSVGFRYFWVFVRHPRWNVHEKPWKQWTLVSEVVLEAGKQRLDKWSLMSRLGNKTRGLITQCAAWMRPDIIYVKRPVYQCRFEPQDGFFRALVPFLDPKTEKGFLFELRNEDGSVEMCTYFAGLCKIVRVNPKAFVDDVVKAFVKLSEENQSRCLEFLLGNHPIQLLHPYTREWKAKLEEEELGCDAPDDDEDVSRSGGSENEFTEWIEVDGDGEDDDQGNVVMDMRESGDDDEDNDQDDVEEGSDDELGIKDDELDPEEDEDYWEEEFKAATSSSERMELLATRSVKMTTKFYTKQMESMEEQEQEQEQEQENETENVSEDGYEKELWGKRAKVSPQEWKQVGLGKWMRKIRKSRIPPELFLRAAVRPFTYRNLVKEIVLTRHAIVDGEIGIKE